MITDNDSTIHHGHRSRMTEKLANHGPHIFNTYELLEMLLYGTIPYKDTNPIAKRLLDRFGSLDGVLSATEDELCTVDGVGGAAAALIRTVGRYGEEHEDEELPPPVNPDKPEKPIPEWIAEIESMILPNGVIYLRRNGVTLRLMGTNVTPSPISYNELLENPPAGAREMTEREKADVFDEKLMESIRDLTE